MVILDGRCLPAPERVVMAWHGKEAAWLAIQVHWNLLLPEPPGAQDGGLQGVAWQEVAGPCQVSGFLAPASPRLHKARTPPCLHEIKVSSQRSSLDAACNIVSPASPPTGTEV